MGQAREAKYGSYSKVGTVAVVEHEEAEIQAHAAKQAELEEAIMQHGFGGIVRHTGWARPPQT